jgi:hypothetical protein
VRKAVEAYQNQHNNEHIWSKWRWNCQR